GYERRYVPFSRQVLSVRVSDTAPAPPIAVHRLSVRFGAIVALDDVSFSVPHGSITGLIGRNGAGKSTSIRCLAGMLRPTSADAHVSVMGRSPTGDARQVLATT